MVWRAPTATDNVPATEAVAKTVLPEPAAAGAAGKPGVDTPLPPDTAIPVVPLLAAATATTPSPEIAPNLQAVNIHAESTPSSSVRLRLCMVQKAKPTALKRALIPSHNAASRGAAACR